LNIDGVGKLVIYAKIRQHFGNGTILRLVALWIIYVTCILAVK